MKQGVGVGRKCFRVGVSLREVDTICKTTEVSHISHKCPILVTNPLNLSLLSLSLLYDRWASRG